MKAKLFCIALAMCLGLSAFSEIYAQSIPEDQKATVVFDLRIKRMRDGELMSGPAFAGMMDDPAALGGMAPSDVDRVFGAVALPDNAAAFAVFQQQEAPEIMPMSFFVRIQMASPAAADSMWREMSSSPDFVETEVNGLTCISNSNELTNVLIHRMSDATIEIGTRDYITAGTGKDVFSAGLLNAWSKVPNHGLRLAVDLQSEAALVSELVGMAKQDPELDITTSAFLDLIDNAENMRFSFDPDDATLLELSATGVDSAQAEELRSGLDGILGGAKFGGKNLLNMARDNPAAAGPVGMFAGDPETFGAMDSLLDSLAATSDGAEVQVSIPRPAGFTNAVGNLMEVLPMMLMGGGPGPPPPGFDDGIGDAMPPEGFEGGDPFGGGDIPAPGGGDPFGGGDAPTAGDGDPFGGGDVPAEGGGDPFGGGDVPAAGGADPFGGGEEPAGEANPFGG